VASSAAGWPDKTSVILSWALSNAPAGERANGRLDVVAEGVETLDLWNRLRDLGCQAAQGYFLSRPVAAQELAAWLKSRPAKALPTAEAA